jgi:predicted transcriptional regulator
MKRVGWQTQFPRNFLPFEISYLRLLSVQMRKQGEGINHSQEDQEETMEERRLLEMTSEIVKAQASHAGMGADEMTEAIKKVYRALKWVQAQEDKAAKGEAEPTMSGMESIQRNKVICLECGKEFRQLSGKHLGLHGLTPREYKNKYDIPLRQSLSARSLSAKRRRIAKERGLGEKLSRARGRKK